MTSKTKKNYNYDKRTKITRNQKYKKNKIKPFTKRNQTNLTLRKSKKPSKRQKQINQVT